MGIEENRRWDPHYVRDDGRPSMAEIWAKEEAQAKAVERDLIENAKADAKAVWALADYLMPADFKQMAENMKLDATMKEMWRNAFIAGWRARHRDA